MRVRPRPLISPPWALVCACLVALSSLRAQAPEPRIIEVTARRFAFEPAEVEVALGERVRLLVRSADGVHGVEIRKFRVKREVPRGGMAVAIEFTASEEGRFPILCSEYCGDGHDDMTGTLVVLSSGAPSAPAARKMQIGTERAADVPLHSDPRLRPLEDLTR